MRYLKVSILIGVIVSLIIIGLMETGVIFQLDQALAHYFGRAVAPFPERVLQYILMVIFAFGIAWTTVDIPRNSLKAVIAVGAVIEVIGAAWVMNFYQIYFSPFVSVVAILGSFAGGFIYSRTETGSRKRVLRQVVGDRVSRQTFAALLDSPKALSLEGERREVTVLVCEIFNHDELEQSLSAPDYVSLTNSFRRNAADFLVENGGYLDECDGESIRVIFGAPLDNEQHTVAACAAALGLVQRLDEVNSECHSVWRQMFDFRIGINSGEMTLAAYGSRRLGTYSVAGEPADFSRRLCRANLIYGSRILLGSGAFMLAETAIEVRPMELIQRFDDGSREEIYELLAPRNVLSDEALDRRDLFWKAVVYYREQLWDEALALFHSARAPGGADGPVEFYIRRIEQLRSGMPALDWNNARL